MAKLLDQVRDLLRVRHYSPRTEEAYLHWIKKYILFHGKQRFRNAVLKSFKNGSKRGFSRYGGSD